MKKCPFICLAGLAVLVTGCPHNEYVVELTPHGNAIERKLEFYRADTDTNGAISYETFPNDELVRITSLYPADSLHHDGDRHSVHAKFTNAMPDDVGGAGSYTNVSTTLGSAGFYVERFRGNDDIAGVAARHFKAADQLTDLALGWSKSELGSEPGYDKLRQFLDVDFRKDLKNFSSYWWQAQLMSACRTNAEEEFIVRIGQYLVERGYLQIGDMPAMWRDETDISGDKLSLMMRRQIARKLGVPDSQPVPASLDFLATDEAISKSFEKYLGATDMYRSKIKQWEEDRKRNPELEKPNPADDALQELVDFKLFAGPPDHLSVKLSLPLAPAHSNGKWDDVRKQVVWDTDIADRTNLVRFPAVCYANWAEPVESFQKEHFGKVALAGDEMTGYCVWRSGLDEKKAAEWDSMLASLRPGGQLTNKLYAFQFSGEPPRSKTNIYTLTDYPCKLIMDGLK